MAWRAVFGADLARRLNIDQELLRRFCHAHHIRRLVLFGAQLKGTAPPTSDVDLLVEFETDRVPGLIGISAMELELSELLDVVPIAHPIVAQGEPGLLASTRVLACRRTGAAPSESWAVAVVPEPLHEAGGVHGKVAPVSPA